MAPHFKEENETYITVPVTGGLLASILGFLKLLGALLVGKAGQLQGAVCEPTSDPDCWLTWGSGGF